MNPSFQSSSPLKAGHDNILEETPQKKKKKTNMIDLKNTFRVVQSHISFYHCAWLLIILLLQLCILLFLNTARRGPILIPPPTTVDQLYPSIHLHRQVGRHHPNQQRQQQVLQHELDLPLKDDDKIQQQQETVLDSEQQQQPIKQENLENSTPVNDHGDQKNGTVKQEVQEQVLINQAAGRDHQLASSPGHPSEEGEEQYYCRYGKVYVYDDLPPVFNRELVVNCDDLDPWKSKCAAVSNDGFGPKASATLEGIGVPRDLARSWWWTDMFSSEIIYHNRMLRYKCRTMEPGSATAFYVPFYVGLAVSKYLYTNYTAKERDAPCERFHGWMKERPYWKRSNGSDHFLMLGRITWDFRRKSDHDWGTRFLLMPQINNMLRLTIERDLLDPLEIGVPYPTGFHPRSASEIQQWQRFVRSRDRSSLFTFVGARRVKVKNDFRGVLLDHCRSESHDSACKLVDCEQTPCSDGSPAIMEAFLHSDFCLQPKGDSDTRKSTFDCMLSGSIPVFFWQGSIRGRWELFLTGEPESYSVFIDQEQVMNGTSSVIRKVLEEGYSREDIKRMRDKIIDTFIPRFLYYAFPHEGLGINDAKDAFDIAIEAVLQKINNTSPDQDAN